MPTYTARCSKCGQEQDFYSKIADRDKTPSCCEQQMDRALTAAMVGAMGIADHAMTVSPIDRKPLYGRSAYLKHLKDNNVLPSSELKGEAEYQKTEKKKVDKKDRREKIREAIAKHS